MKGKSELLALFCDVLQYSSYNVGQYVKIFHCNDIHKIPSDVFSIIIDHCPNIKALGIPNDCALLNYFVATFHEKKEEEGVVLWRNLRSLNLQPSGNFVYCC